MSNLPAKWQQFTFDGQMDVRAIPDENGEPLFVAADVCRALGITNISNAIARLDDDEKDDIRVADTIGRMQDMTAVNESGLYNLIIRSDKPEAKTFKRWITHEVLPALRKTGTFTMQVHTPAELVLQMAQQIVNQERTIADQQKALSEHDDRLNRIEARQSSSDTPVEYFTIVGYCKYRRVVSPNEKEAQSLGKRAASLSRQRNVPIGTTTHKVYGVVNTYHLSVLDDLFHEQGYF